MAKDWDGLDALVSERRPPIGLLPFITVARANGAPKPVLARWVPHACALICSSISTYSSNSIAPQHEQCENSYVSDETLPFILSRTFETSASYDQLQNPTVNL